MKSGLSYLEELKKTEKTIGVLTNALSWIDLNYYSNHLVIGLNQNRSTSSSYYNNETFSKYRDS